MKYYQELTILPDPEINMYFIWQKLYTQLHIALADLKNNHGIDSVGVSFPNYKYGEKNAKEYATLGNKLRIFAPDEETLATLNINQWLERLTDHIHIKSIKAIPNDKVTSQLIVSRYRFSSLAKQVQNYIALNEKQGRKMNEAEAIEHCEKYRQAGRRNYPFINLKSNKNGQNFKLAVKQICVDDAITGSFNTYGVNTNEQKVTVPHWEG